MFVTCMARLALKKLITNNLVKKTMKHNFFLLALYTFNLYSGYCSVEIHSKPNILMIIVDDLRPELGCYGTKDILTPNIDKIASKGILFQEAYANVAVCGPSRSCIMSGLRPIQGKRFDAWNCRIDKDATGFPTIPEFFKKQGYCTISNGKVMHIQEDSPEAWLEKAWRSNKNHGADIHWYNIYDDWADTASDALAQPMPVGSQHQNLKKGPFWEAADVPDNGYHDGQLCDKTVKDIQRMAETKQTFFIACGFWRPHLPFNAPKKYWDLYDREKIQLANNRYFPEHGPKNLKNSTEISQYVGQEGWPTEENFHRLAKHGYYASVSYIDAQIGKLLKTLESTGLEKNTIVVVWGDHGYHLGEHNFWGKHNLTRGALRTPLLIKVPGYSAVKISQLVESVDVYPTLCELASITLPSHLVGKSLVPLFSNPEANHIEEIFAVTSWDKGLAVKTKQFLYAEWGIKGIGGRMLFDHKIDLEENINVAENPEYAETVKNLHNKLVRYRKNLNFPNDKSLHDQETE